MGESAARRARAEKFAAQRATMEQAHRRRQVGIVGGVVLAVLVVAVGVGALIQADRDDSTSGPTPANVTGTSGGTILVGRPDAPATVTVYEDFLCPACRQFEEQSGTVLAEAVAAGTVRVEYRPIAILDRYSTDKYATRALGAVGCVVNTTPNAFLKFHDALFTNQPAEGGAGLPADRLAQLAEQAGAGNVRACVQEGTFEDWAARVTDQSSRDGVRGTPTVLINGQPLENPDPVSLETAITTAAGVAATPSPSSVTPPSQSPASPAASSPS
ncbi:MAG: DsbA family protein [Actinomycetota bacterium]